VLSAAVIELKQAKVITERLKNNKTVMKNKIREIRQTNACYKTVVGFI
jgi:hypothetical protein